MGKMEKLNSIKGLFVPCSGNMKTGNVSSWYSSPNTCPSRCPFKDNGCYAENFHCKMAWQKATHSLEECREKAYKLGILDLMRVNVAGDIAIPNTNRINKAFVDWMIDTFAEYTTIWTYTHCSPTAANIAVVKDAIARGFTISFSCESLKVAEKLHAEGVPVVLATDKITETNSKYFVCQGGKDGMTCRKCKMCTKPNRKKIIVFNLHGARVNAARKAVENID